MELYLTIACVVLIFLHGLRDILCIPHTVIFSLSLSLFPFPPPPPPPPPYLSLYVAPLFYNHMKSYLLTEDQLRDNGYPRSTSRQGEASIQRELAQSDQIHPVGPNAMQHRCSRCGKPFIIYNSGQYQSLDECIYHYGKLIKNRGEL